MEVCVLAVVEAVFSVFVLPDNLHSQEGGDKPQFSSWGLMPTNISRCFHAMSVHLRPIVQLKRIT